MDRLILSRPRHGALRCVQRIARCSGKEHTSVLRGYKHSAKSISTAAASETYNDSRADPLESGGSSARNVASSGRRDAIKNAKPFSDFLTDTFNRQHDYLRISLTERCNLRCLYCMPEEGVPLSPQSHLLTTPEIYYLSSLFVSQGVTKIRLTGGEPTIRRDILPLMQQIGSLRPNGLKELAITTNGISLHRKLDSMAESGLTGVNLSLDTLDPFQFQIMTRRKGFDAVMKSIERILEMNKLGAGIKLKVNCVVMRGLNEREIVPFVEMGREKDIEVRFIEYMPFDGNKWSRGKMLPYQEMLDMIREKYPGLRKVQDHKNDTSKTFEVPGFVGKVGFITSMTHNFCGTCNRLRITSDGSLKVCLFGNTEVSLRDLLRKGNKDQPIDEASFEALKQIEMDRHQGLLPRGTALGWSGREQELLNVIGAAVKRKKAGHAELGELENMKNRPMILIDRSARMNKLGTSHPSRSARSSALAAPWSHIPFHMLGGIPQGPTLMHRASLHTESKRKSRIQVVPGFAGTKQIPAQSWLFSKKAKIVPAQNTKLETKPLDDPFLFDEIGTSSTPTADHTGDSLEQSNHGKHIGKYGQIQFPTTPQRMFPTVIHYHAEKKWYTLVPSVTFLDEQRQQIREQVIAGTLAEDEGYIYETTTSDFFPFSKMPHRPAVYRKLCQRLQENKSPRYAEGFGQDFVNAIARKHFYESDERPEEGTRNYRPKFLLRDLGPEVPEGSLRLPPDTFRRICKTQSIDRSEGLRPSLWTEPRRLDSAVSNIFKPADLQASSGISVRTQKARLHSTPNRSSTPPVESSSLSEPSLTHLDASGAAKMVSISEKPHTVRRAIAIGRIAFSNPDPASLIARNAIKKGDVLSIARIAGITAAKKTPEFIPLCHPIPLTSVVIDLDLVQPGDDAEIMYGCINVHATVECTGATGVEMEALMGVWGAVSTVYDMCKAVDKGMSISSVKVVLKEGGRSGMLVDPTWHSENLRALQQEQSNLSSQTSPSKPTTPLPEHPQPTTEKHDPFAPAVTGPGTAFISLADRPPAGDAKQQPPNSVVSNPASRSEDNSLKLVLPAVLMIMILFAGVEVVRSKRTPSPPKPIGPPSTSSSPPYPARSSSSQIAESHRAANADAAEPAISEAEIEARATAVKAQRDRDAKHKIDDRTLQNILKRKNRGVGMPSASDAAASAAGITKIPDEDVAARREVAGQKGSPSVSDGGVPERSNLDKAVIVGMLIVWPVAHIAWYLSHRN